MPKNESDLYLPQAAEIREIIEENSQIKTFVLAFRDELYNRDFFYEPGQFMMVSLPHCGEAPISFSSTPAQGGTIHLSVRKAGRLTEAMHGLAPGAVVGLRGPYGRPFPTTELAGRDLLFVAGGIGLAPLRSLINSCLADNRFQENRLTILYGSRTPSDIAFARDIDSWQAHPRVECRLSVDSGEPGWDGQVGLVTTLLDQVELQVKKNTALVCGPPLMIRSVLKDLQERGFSEERIVTTLERQMKCGVGICRHCHLDGRLVCREGPVFTLAQLQEMEAMELG